MTEDKKDENINSSNENEENLEKTENQPSVDENITTSDLSLIHISEPTRHA